LSEGTKYDKGKPSMGLLPWTALKEVARVLDYGTIKYEKYNWLEGMEWSRNYNAALRHIADWIEGENLDESGINHLAHAICDLLFVLTYQLMGLGTDDRWKGKEKGNGTD